MLPPWFRFCLLSFIFGNAFLLFFLPFLRSELKFLNIILFDFDGLIRVKDLGSFFFKFNRIFPEFLTPFKFIFLSFLFFSLFFFFYLFISSICHIFSFQLFLPFCYFDRVYLFLSFVLSFFSHSNQPLFLIFLCFHYFTTFPLWFIYFFFLFFFSISDYFEVEVISYFLNPPLIPIPVQKLRHRMMNHMDG